MDILFFIFLILTIIVLSAIVSSSEAALLSVSIGKIKEILNTSKNKKQKHKAKNLISIKDNLQKHISTIVILNNIINIIGSIYVGVLATKIFGQVYVGMISGILTFLIIIFAEIIPKLYGEKYSLEISIVISNILIKTTWTLTPILKFIGLITKIFIKENPNGGVSEGEIKELAYLSQEEGNITKEESERITNVFKLDDLSVYDIMIPKHKTRIIDYNAKFSEVIDVINETGFTRLPVIRNGEIAGLINAKDLFKYHNNRKNFMIGKILRPILYAPESMKLNVLEEKFKKERNHMAIVINEHGDFIGIVTFEDIIEEVIGEIEDEFDPLEKPLINEMGEGKYIVDTCINIDELEEELNIELEDLNDEYSTLNGYLIDKFGNIPRVNQDLKTNKYSIRVLRISKRRILEVEIFVK